MKSLLVLMSLVLVVAAAKANDESNLTFWHTGTTRASFHHSEECGLYATPSLVVQDGSSLVEALTPLAYYFAGSGKADYCGTYRKYELEKEYGKLTKLGKKIACPTNLCHAGTDSLVGDVVLYTEAYNEESGAHEISRINSVTFFDQGYVAVTYSNSCLDCGTQLQVKKMDVSNPQTLRQQILRLF